mmetsp:Transcript_144607/g.367090  ORF Transcript_144607/g.367090 Transcript_144607/m.367090 type:complete len:255 (+) Transcript_144607:86-850(+)
MVEKVEAKVQCFYTIHMLCCKKWSSDIQLGFAVQWLPTSLVEQLAAVVLLLELIRIDEARELGADVLLEPRLAVVRLEPSDAALLLQWVAARECAKTAEELLVQPRGLVHVGRLPALVPVAGKPVLVFLDLSGVRHALRHDLLFDLAQLRIVARAPEDLAQLDLERAKLEHQAVDLLALLVLLGGGPHPVAQALGSLRFLKAHLADPPTIRRLKALLTVPLLKHPVQAVAAHGRQRLRRRCPAADEGVWRGHLP